MCYSIAFIENCMGFASISSIFFITCDRYYVICRPLSVKSTMTQSRTLKLILSIWVVSILINLPFVFLTEYDLRYFSDNQQMEYRCDAKSRGEWSFYYIIVTTFIFYLIIGLILIFMYYEITCKLNNSNKFLVLSSINKHDDQNNDYNEHHFHHNLKNSKLTTSKTLSSINFLNEQSKTNVNCETANKNLEKFIRQRQKLIFMLMCIICVFYICLFPLKIWNLVIMVGSKVFNNAIFRNLQYKHYWIINITTRIFFYINSSINPILYNFLSKKFRRSFGRIFLFRLCCQNNQSKQLIDLKNNETIKKSKNIHNKNQITNNCSDSMNKNLKSNQDSNFSFLANLTPGVDSVNANKNKVNNKKRSNLNKSKMSERIPLNNQDDSIKSVRDNNIEII
jgi:hypothetical protein